MSLLFVDPFSEAKRAYIDDEFMSLNKAISFCNPGSFGVVPKSVLAEQFRYMTEVESDPDRWMRLTSMRLWLENRQAIAPNFGVASPNNLAFVTNASSAVNAVVSSIEWKKGDVLMITDWSYRSIRAICEDLVERNDCVDLYKVKFPYPISDPQCLVDAFVEAVEEIAASGKNPRLCILDAVGSLPSLRYPFEEIVKKLSPLGVELLVDGAHAPGQIDLNLDTLGADYFVGNLEKWFFCPKGTAVLYVAPKHQSHIRAPIVSMTGGALSKGWYLEDFLANNFFWQGTTNNTSFACVKKAIEFIENVGGLQIIREYNTKLSSAAANLILKRCPRTEPFRICDELVAPHMKSFLVTARNNQPTAPHHGFVDCLQSYLYHNCNVWTCVCPLRHAGDQYYGDDTAVIRLSTQINNKLADFERLAVGVNQFVLKGFDFIADDDA